MHKPFKWRTISTARTLSVMMFMSGIGLTISIIALLYLSLHLISAKTNEIDDQRSALAVQGAIQTKVNKMSALVLDNAIWDEAVNHVYGAKYDERWLYSTWGVGYKINNLYDGTFVLDDNFHPLWGAFRSEVFYDRGTAFLGNGFNTLVSAHKAALRDNKRILAGITRTRAGIAFFAVGLIRPMIGPQPQSSDAHRYLVMVHHLNSAMLTNLGNTFQISHLEWRDTPPPGVSVPFRSAAGELLGYLTWEPQRPGMQAARAASSDITRIALLAAGLIVLFIILSSVGLYKLARGEKLARELAMTDWLSHLPNRRALIERLEDMGNRDADEQTCVVFIDLDGFKDVNDIYGHDVGDQLIMTLAGVLHGMMPRGGMLARLGGDEFALTLDGEQAAERASAFSRAVLEYLVQPVRLGERTIHISASIGIASCLPHECNSSELFRRADIAMYHSKITGKGRITHYDAELNNVREHQLAIENEIRDGLIRCEFDVWYQPIVDADTLKMTGVEALARWPRRPAGPLTPDVFIGIAESSGLIYALGQFVLRRACRDLLPLGDLMLSVNISPAQFRDPDFETKVANIISSSGFPARRLELEVTETYVLENPERARGAIGNLKALGTAVALDDFGTGYSSIGYLRRFNFDTIKIDKSLAGLIDTDEQASALVSGTIRIASALGMSVTAEGVENDNQRVLLSRAGCDRLQGFWFNAPMSIRDLLALYHQDAPPQTADRA